MQVTIENLNACLDGSNQYETPLFQRPFAWKEKHWQRLWEDLLSYYDDASDYVKAKHFMGAIVVQRRTGGGAISHYWTIDGQQRLTTFSILLCALRDLNENNKEIVMEVPGYLTNHKRPEAASDYLKLALGEQDRDAFAAVALKKTLDPNAEESQVAKCYEFFKERLREEARDENFSVERFYRVVRDVPQVVLIDLDESDDPYMIFESLNFKGEPLQSVDLIRNFVLMKFQDSNEQKQIYTDSWKPIEDILGESAEDFFFHYVRKATQNKIVKSRVYEEFKQFFGGLTVEEARRELTEIGKNARWYGEFLAPENLKNREIAYEFDVLKTVKCQVVYPLLLRLNERCLELGVDRNEKNGEYVRFLRVLNSFIIRRVFGDGQSTIANSLATSLIRGLEEAERPFDRWLEIFLITQKGKSSWPDDDAFRAGIKQTKVNYSGYYPERAKLFLSAVERKVGGKEAGDVENATVEHILPQTLNDEWRRELGANAEEIYADYLHSLGNLTLTKINPELGNASYEAKRRQYQRSCFSLNRYVAQNFERWTAKEIEERADFLADRAIEIWARPDSRIGEIAFLTFNDDWTHRQPQRVVWDGKAKTAKYWRDVYRATLETICERVGEENFERGVKTAGLATAFATEPGAGGFRVEMKISDRIYAEINLSAESIRRNLKKLAETAGISVDDWRVYLR